MTMIFLLALALSPGLAIILYIYLKDHHEPEPIRPLFIGFVSGIVAFIIATGAGTILEQWIDIRDRNLYDQVIKAFLIVACVEEGSKFFFLRGILYPNKNFNEPFDGIVYSVMIGMGFATTENVIYVLQGGGGTAIVRMFTAVPAHATFAILMGFFVGEDKIVPGKGLMYSFLGLLLATLFHGIYDYFLFISFKPGLWIGAIASIVIALLLSGRAIRLHQDASPFKDKDQAT